MVRMQPISIVQIHLMLKIKAMFKDLYKMSPLVHYTFNTNHHETLFRLVH